VMTLLGRANWWFPGWLDRIVPNFSIEGEEWFEERDRRAAPPAAPVPVLAGEAVEPKP
jgi:putative drug exporter of the RND superfamily